MRLRRHQFAAARISRPAKFSNPTACLYAVQEQHRCGAWPTRFRSKQGMLASDAGSTRRLDRVLQLNFHGGGCGPRRSFRSPDQQEFPLSFQPETVDKSILMQTCTNSTEHECVNLCKQTDVGSAANSRSFREIMPSFLSKYLSVHKDLLDFGDSDHLVDVYWNFLNNDFFHRHLGVKHTISAKAR